MTDEARPAKGSICHIEIASTDLAKSRAFYSAIFGWAIQDNAPFSEYWFFKAGDTSGAFTLGAKPSDNGPILVLAVEDIPSTLEQIEMAGGSKLTEKTEIGGNMGYYAYFKDPSGNKLGIWSPT